MQQKIEILASQKQQATFGTINMETFVKWL